MPGFGVVVHQGRRSGRLYQAPVNVFATEDGYVLALTYGPGTDWVKNVLVAGGCELRTRGRAIRLASPRLFPAMTGPPRKDPVVAENPVRAGHHGVLTCGKASVRR